MKGDGFREATVLGEVGCPPNSCRSVVDTGTEPSILEQN